jgi:glycosyltransferase involved in cell wall biosynthesis
VRVLHVVPSYYPAVRYGGPIESVKGLCGALAACGVELDVATTNADGPGDLDVPTDRWCTQGNVRVRYFRRWPKIEYATSASLARFLAREAGRYDLVHVTSTFSFPALAAGAAARRARVPYVVSPRGSLQPWSLSQKGWKKRPYWWLIEHRHLSRAAAIHATAEIERAAVAQLLPGASVVVVPNGMEPVTPPPVPRAGRTIVFLGRLHAKKGFDVLVPALSLLARDLPDVETVVAGPDDHGEWARVEALLAKSSPRPAVRWIGPVHGPKKFELLASAATFVLSSHSENFGQAVVEALACGTPVVVSRNCPWSSVQERGAGFWVDNTAADVAKALKAVLLAGPSYASMQAAARALAAEYSWPAVGSAMMQHYVRLIQASRA